MTTDDREIEIIEREVHHVHEAPPSRGRFLAGFVLALILVAAAIVAYFVVSDDDADGRLDIDVPSVDVDVDVDE